MSPSPKPVDSGRGSANADRDAADAGQRRADSRNGAIVLTLLGINGFIVGLLSVVFLNVHIHTVAFPISAVAAAILNTSLLWLASGFSDGAPRYAPIIGWLLPVAAGLLGGPGGDVLLYEDWRTLLLVVLGLAVPVVISYGMSTASTPRRSAKR